MEIKLHPVTVGEETRYVPFNILNSRFHWAKIARWKKAWAEETWSSMLEAKVKPGQHRTIRITLKSIRPMDKDNMYGSVKPIVDQLTGGKDSQAEITLEVGTEKVMHKIDQGVLIELEA